MKRNKQFDCVQMNWDIQQKISEEFAGMSDQEAHDSQMAQVMRNPSLGPFCKKVRSLKKTLRK